ncbi:MULTISPECIES: TetR/AcrR family transcriptional regulator [unclassified Rhodococcus (in: high G+C Gram-positive bacteria)]|uniref:TetR/AcrR family transcriptional regulator n=1 Tax=unclassified Rhodococcus (in: high G+C Gram-positive bacteria) TaxID=192944 RepID=UPI00146F2185|nr:TetR/AcrR family transcriptional regulator [Rhodococcus sp. 105337]NME78760.1 TetR/AcrR family transcriptional regulator [Rhodococcus sp. 105337]
MTSPTPRRYAGLTGEQRAASRRESLLEAGLEVFAAAGQSGATMTAICAQAKLTERYFYESFTSRDELLQAVLDRIADEIRDAGLSALRTSTGTLEQRVRNAITAFVTILTDDPRKGRVAMIQSAAFEPLRSHRRAALRGFAQMVADEATLMYGDRAWPPHQGEINGLLFVGGLAELVTAWLNDEIAITPEEIVDAATHQFTSTAHR